MHTCEYHNGVLLHPHCGRPAVKAFYCTWLPLYDGQIPISQLCWFCEWHCDTITVHAMWPCENLVLEF
jgi:hypothetical protein